MFHKTEILGEKAIEQMESETTLWASPREFLVARTPDRPVSFFCPRSLHETARLFTGNFPGLVTYAVKANPNPSVITNLNAAGVSAFDVASPAEIDLIRALVPSATLHYNNPVRSRSEIAHAVALGVRSFSVDARSELQKIAQAVPEAAQTEIAVRLKLPVKGASYDFGEKFGADEITAAALLKMAQGIGFKTSMTFHPGTQCLDPQAWVAYVRACARIADQAGVRLARLNVGGGFPADRNGTTPELKSIFGAIGNATTAYFGKHLPELVCEPGRAMVAEAFTLATRVKAIHDKGTIFLNDGIYGGLTEFRDLDTPDRHTCLSPEGKKRVGAASLITAFGPTCDSLDALPEPLVLPDSLQEEDYILFAGMGAYVHATCTRFNGYGDIQSVTVNAL